MFTWLASDELFTLLATLKHQSSHLLIHFSHSCGLEKSKASGGFIVNVTVGGTTSHGAATAAASACCLASMPFLVFFEALLAEVCKRAATKLGLEWPTAEVEEELQSVCATDGDWRQPPPSSSCLSSQTAWRPPTPLGERRDGQASPWCQGGLEVCRLLWSSPPQGCASLSQSPEMEERIYGVQQTQFSLCSDLLGSTPQCAWRSSTGSSALQCKVRPSVGVLASCQEQKKTRKYQIINPL